MSETHECGLLQRSAITVPNREVMAMRNPFVIRQENAILKVDEKTGAERLEFRYSAVEPCEMVVHMYCTPTDDARLGNVSTPEEVPADWDIKACVQLAATVDSRSPSPAHASKTPSPPLPSTSTSTSTSAPAPSGSRGSVASGSSQEKEMSIDFIVQPGTLSAAGALGVGSSVGGSLLTGASAVPPRTRILLVDVQPLARGAARSQGAQNGQNAPAQGQGQGQGKEPGKAEGQGQGDLPQWRQWHFLRFERTSGGDRSSVGGKIEGGGNGESRDPTMWVRYVVEQWEERMKCGSKIFNIQKIFSARESETQKGFCLICQATPADTMVIPCRHLCVCAECAEPLKRQYPARCPVCRTPLRSFVLLDASPL